jgi:hypothetical protein
MRRWVVIGAAVAVIIALTIAANARRSEHIGRGGSTALGQGQPVAFTVVPTEYRVRYRLEEQLGNDVRVSTERLAVRRPFESSLETWTGAPPGKRRLSRDVSAFGRSSTSRSGAARVVSEQPPTLAAHDVRVRTILRSLARRERRRVLGQTCQVYRSDERLTVLTALGPPRRDRYVDSCIAANGLVLEEVQVRSGHITTRRIAAGVAERLTSERFDVGAATIDVKNGGGSTRAVDPATMPPGQFWQLDQPPLGFAMVGRYAVVPPQPENFTDPAREGLQRAGVTDVWRHGVDVIGVDQGGTLRGSPPFRVDESQAVIDAGQLTHGELLLTGQGAELRFLTGGGHYVRVFGTVAIDDLLTVARQLHQVPGGELKYL